MWRRRPVVVIALFALLAACANSDAGSETPSDSTSSGTIGPSPTDSKQSDCPFNDDTAEPAIRPLIQILPPDGSSFTELTGEQRITCLTRLQVDQRGALDVIFGGAARCQLTQDQPEEKVAGIVTRDPSNALFRVLEGRALCTIMGGTHVELCDRGTLIVTDPSQMGITCDPDPVFNVLAYAGSVGAIDPNDEEWVIPPGMGIEHSFESGETREVTANFNPPDVAVFAQQAAALGLPPLPQGAPRIDESDGTFVAVEGDWAGSPSPTFSYQWQGGCLAENGSDGCTDITGATQSTYTPTASDCPRVRVVVTGSSTNGSNRAPSEARLIDFLFDCGSPSQSATGSPVIG